MRNIFVFFAGNERGGAAAHITSLARTVARYEAQREYRFLSFGQGPLATAVSAQGVWCEIISANAIRGFSQLTAILNGHSNAILHSHGPRLNILASFAARRAGIPWTATIHSHPAYDFLGNSLKSKLYPALHLWRLRHCVGLFAVQSSLVPVLPVSTVLDVPNAVDIEPLSVPRHAIARSWQQKLNLPENTQFIGLAARFDPVKNIDVLLQALTLMDTPTVHLLLAGDGPMKQEFAEMVNRLGIAQRVHFLGFLSDLKPFYGALDIHILPSKSEGTPFCVLEAGAYAAANITSDIPSLRELLLDGEAGCLTPVGDARQLATAVDALLQNPNLRKQYVDRFRTLVLPKFTPKKMLEAYERGYTVLEEDIIRSRQYGRAW